MSSQYEKAQTGILVPSYLQLEHATFLNSCVVSESVKNSSISGVRIEMVASEWHVLFRGLDYLHVCCTRVLRSTELRKFRFSLQLSGAVFARAFASFSERKNALGFLCVVVSWTHAQKSNNLDAKVEKKRRHGGGRLG